MTKKAAAFAFLAAANAACIAREILGIAPDHLSEIGNFDNVNKAAVRLAVYEIVRRATDGSPLWEDVSWEEVCAKIARHLVKTGRPFPNSAFRKALRPVRLRNRRK